MASDFEKPDRVHTLFDEEIPAKLWPLPVGELYSVGRATADKLQRQGIKTIGALASLDPSLIVAMVGEKQGMMLHEFANGRDDSPVRTHGEAAKGYSNSVTLSENITTLAQAHGVLLSLIDNAASRMRADGARAYCVGVSIRTDQFKNFSHQRKLKEPTDITAEILEIAEQLLREFWDRRMPLRLIGVSLTMITHEQSEQVSLFPDERRERRRKIDHAVDSIRGRFGRGTIHRAAQMNEESDTLRETDLRD
jgi:DNA polymerase-4